VENIGFWVIVLIIFFAGWGWGQWLTERSIRIEKTAVDRGRLTVSMPMKPEDAAATMGLLKNLIEQVEAEKKESR